MVHKTLAKAEKMQIERHELPQETEMNT